MPDPAALARLKSWVLDHGGVCSDAVDLVADENGYTRVVATKPLPPNSTIVSCPHSLVIDWKKALRGVPEVLQAIATRPSPGSARPHTLEHGYERPIWAFFLAMEYVRGEQSEFYPYISTLPPPDILAKNGMFFGQAMGQWARGTNLRKDIDLRMEAWRADFDWVALACAESGEEWQDLVKKVNWKLFLWASLIYTSRAFPDSLLETDNPDSKVDVDSIQKSAKSSRPALIPLVDMLNHKPMQKITWMKGTDSLSLISVEETPAGQELFNNYGPKGNAELITGYGFALENNPFDTFPLNFRPPLSDMLKKLRALQPTKQESSIFHIHRAQPSNAAQSHNNLLSASNSMFPLSLITLVELLVASQRELKYLEEHPSATPLSLRNSLTRDMQLLQAVESKMAPYIIKPTTPEPATDLQRALKTYMISQHSLLLAAKAELETRLAVVSTPAGRLSVNATTLADMFAEDEPFRSAVEEVFGSADPDDLREAGYAEQVFSLGITRKYILYRHSPTDPSLTPKWFKWLEGVIPYVPLLGSEHDALIDETWKEWEERRKENSWLVWQDILSGGDAHPLFSGMGWGLEAVLWGQRVWDEEGWSVNGLEGIGLSGLDGEH